jgi:hypothetical protein
VFWIDASSAENAETSFAKIDEHVRGGAIHSKGASFSAAMHWLLQARKPWLLILDNADDPDMDVSRYFPAGSHGHILITTRNPSVIEHATIGHIRFRGMDPEEAIRLLLKTASPVGQAQSPNSSTRTLAQGIASELGYLALPLAQAGTTIRRRIYSLERYLHHYLGHRKVMMSYSRIQGADDANIITTWEIPFQRIANRPSVEYRDAVDLLHMFAFMHFESIPEEIFERTWNEIEESRIDPAAFPNILQPNRNEDLQVRLRSAIRVLSDYSIVDHEPATRSCILHPVIHAWARERLNDAEQRKWLNCTMSVLSLSISPRLEASGRKFRQLLMPHMDLCLRTLKQQCPVFPDSLERAVEVEKFAWVYAENGLWDTARDLQIKIVELRRSRLGSWHEATIRAKRHLGFTYWNLFEMKPLIMLQIWTLIALWFIRPSLNHWINWTPWMPDHVPYCLALDDLTQSLWLVGKRERSKQVGERAVDGLVKHLGREDPKTLNAMFNLARTHLHLGNHAKSRDLLLYVLRKRKRFFGTNHLDTLMTRNELGILLCAQKRNLHLAERLIANVLESRKQILGEEHAYTLWSVNDLSKVVCERGRPAEAVEMLQKIIPIVTRTLGNNHVGMSMTKSNLARAFALCEDWASAEELLGPLTNVIPVDHPDWIHMKYGHVRIQVRLGNLDAVEKECVQLLDQITRSKILGMENPRTIAIAEELLKVYRSQNRLAEIDALKNRVPAMDENNFVGDSFDVYAIRKSSQAMNASQMPRIVDASQLDVDQSPRSPYKYLALPSNSSFRILELFPGQRDSELTCRLHLEDWTQDPTYEALSYAWGDSKIRFPIVCDGQSLEITANLRAGLNQLRQTDKSRFLWADAICIDQKNLQERGQQVSVMRQIYKNARNVVVWLGQDENDQAVEAAHFITHLADVLCGDIPGTSRGMKDIDDLYNLTSNASLIQAEAPWLAVAWYLSQPWFQRLWVFQEVNSNIDVDVICGETHLSWDSVGLAATYIKRWPSLREQIAHVDNCFWYNAYIMRSRHHQATISVAAMLSQGQNFVTTDPRDRIYALLGTLPLREWENKLQPDYHRSRLSLYLDVARRCLLDAKDPFFLSYIQHNRGVEIENFPSWIPQWDQERVRVPMGIPKANWAACGESHISAATKEDGLILTLRGAFFDKALSKLEIDPDELFNSNEHYNGQENTEEHPLLDLWRTQRDYTSKVYSSVGRLLIAFAATFVLAYRINYGADYRKRLVPDFIAYVTRLIGSSAQKINAYPEMQGQASGGDWKNYVHVAHSMSYKRCFFRTSKGYMCLGPNAMEAGDVVCILFGCKVPYVLRPVDGHYLLVGDAYVHGIMDGEAMEQLASGELKEELLIIH